MNLNESQQAARVAGTAQRESLKKVVPQIVKGVIIVLMILIPTVKFASFMLSPAKEAAATTTPPGKVARRAEAATPADPCRGEKTYVFGATWTKIQDESAPCASLFYYTKQEVRFFVRTWSSPDDKVGQGPYKWGDQFPDDVIAVRSEGKELRVKVGLIPKRFSSSK